MRSGKRGGVFGSFGFRAGTEKPQGFCRHLFGLIGLAVAKNLEL